MLTLGPFFYRYLEFLESVKKAEAEAEMQEGVTPKSKDKVTKSKSYRYPQMLNKDHLSKAAESREDGF